MDAAKPVIDQPSRLRSGLGNQPGQVVGSGGLGRPLRRNSAVGFYSTV
jgi:hypothetical protein